MRLTCIDDGGYTDIIQNGKEYNAVSFSKGMVAISVDGTFVYLRSERFLPADVYIHYPWDLVHAKYGTWVRGRLGKVTPDILYIYVDYLEKTR